MTHVPEDFHLPTGEDYDDLVHGLNDEILEEGGANFYLGMIRYERRHQQSFYVNTLKPLSQKMHNIEVRDPETNLTKDPGHQIANAALSGALFGNLMNEGFYPNFNVKYHPYHRLAVYEKFMGEHKAAFIANGGSDTVKGVRVAYRSMANLVLSQFSDASVLEVDSWSESLIPNADFRPYFTEGVGIALYSAWDIYGDLLVADNRSSEVKLPDHLAKDN